jgi:hypothetical protein
LATDFIQIFMQVLSELGHLICVEICDMWILKVNELHFLNHRSGRDLHCCNICVEELGLIDYFYGYSRYCLFGGSSIVMVGPGGICWPPNSVLYSTSGLHCSFISSMVVKGT